MMLTRLFDDRMQRMQRQGRISFYMKSTGEEAVSVAQGWRCSRATCFSRRTASRACNGARPKPGGPHVPVPVQHA